MDELRKASEQRRRTKAARSIALGACLLAAVVASPARTVAQDARPSYGSMAPVEQYLMDRPAEIALARSAAPAAISRDATVLVLGRHGYETAVQGTNGWVCMVERGWVGPFDSPEFWNPKIRGADCLNPPAARSVLPFAFLRTKLLLAGQSKADVIAAIKAALDKKALPSVEAGSVCYMMAKSSYLTDDGDHNGPHLMFYESGQSDTTWGANIPNSPVVSIDYWHLSAQAYPQLRNFPLIRVFAVGVSKWSDGTSARDM